MNEACSVITRGGVTYQIRKPEPSTAAEVVHWLKVGRTYYRVARRLEGDRRTRRAEQREPEELSKMRASLDLNDRDDVRAGALLAALCSGVRKRELVNLDVRDVVDLGNALTLRIRPAEQGRRAPERLVNVLGENAELLRRYLAREHIALEAPESPLFWTLGRHGRCRRTRITGHAVTYWVGQIRRRSGIEERLTPRSFRRVLQADETRAQDSETVGSARSTLLLLSWNGEP